MTRLDRRLAPRPLPAHLGSAMLLWLSSRAALTSLASGWPPWSAQEGALPENLRALVAQVAQNGAEAVGAALDRELFARADRFAAGLDAYRRHPYRRAAPQARVIWCSANARLLDYGGAGPGVLLVPSLINRYYVLDLLPDRSFVRFLAGRGLRPFVLDWGEPGEIERDFTLAGYISGPLESAMAASVEVTGAPVGIIGYCMGGLLALALALRRPAETACLALLATPWDFHAERGAQARLLAAAVEAALLGRDGPLPVEAIQGLFLALDPFLAERKFIAFGGLDQDSEAARDFVALEDWINDGVPLARNVALECARSWYRDNEPAGGEWRVVGRPVRPEEVRAPSLVVLPSRDRIVPPLSAAPLAAAIPKAKVLRPSFGHIGMMASASAPETVWPAITEWLAALLRS